MKRSQLKNSFLLLLTAAIWGSAFVAQSVGMDYVKPFTFNGIRSAIGALFLIPCIFLFRNHTNSSEVSPADQLNQKTHASSSIDRKTLFFGGLCCGIVLAAASSLQQIGISYTSVGKAGFLTAIYIVLVPILSLFLKKRCSPLVWLSVALAVGGLYLLSVPDGFGSIGKGDLLLIAGSFLFAVHILVIDYFSPRCNGVALSCIQFFVCGVLSAVGMLFTETPDISNIQAAWLPLLYAGLLSCGVGYTLQIVGQKGINPVIASLIMSLESVISALAGWVILGQVLSPKEILGCVLMFVAIIITQIPIGNKKTD